MRRGWQVEIVLGEPADPIRLDIVAGVRLPDQVDDAMRAILGGEFLQIIHPAGVFGHNRAVKAEVFPGERADGVGFGFHILDDRLEAGAVSM